jgi:hypothetical protein
MKKINGLDGCNRNKRVKSVEIYIKNSLSLHFNKPILFAAGVVFCAMAGFPKAERADKPNRKRGKIILMVRFWRR